MGWTLWSPSAALRLPLAASGDLPAGLRTPTVAMTKQELGGRCFWGPRLLSGHQAALAHIRTIAFLISGVFWLRAVSLPAQQGVPATTEDRRAPTAQARSSERGIKALGAAVRADGSTIVAGVPLGDTEGAFVGDSTPPFAYSLSANGVTPVALAVADLGSALVSAVSVRENRGRLAFSAVALSSGDSSRLVQFELDARGSLTGYARSEPLQVIGTYPPEAYPLRGGKGMAALTAAFSSRSRPLVVWEPQSRSRLRAYSTGRMIATAMSVVESKSSTEVVVVGRSDATLRSQCDAAFAPLTGRDDLVWTQLGTISESACGRIVATRTRDALVLAAETLGAFGSDLVLISFDTLANVRRSYVINGASSPTLAVRTDGTVVLGMIVGRDGKRIRGFATVAPDGTLTRCRENESIAMQFGSFVITETSHEGEPDVAVGFAVREDGVVPIGGFALQTGDGCSWNRQTFRSIQR